MSKKEKTALNSRRGKTGGEALIEGVMMKSAKRYAVSVRLPDGSIKTKVEECHPAKEKHKWMGLPLIRGVVGFVESMILSYRCLGYSAEALGLDEAEPEYGPYDFDNYRYYAGTALQCTNIYPLMYAKGFYDGLKEAGEKDILSLVRCAWAGSQKYGVLTWSGDIHSSFRAMREQLQAGLSMSVAGIPWWTSDIGGFLGGNIQDEGFRELLVRWFAWGCFCPVFRMHGERSPWYEREQEFINGVRQLTSGQDNEVWSFGEDNYEILKKYLFVRENLRPYMRKTMDECTAAGTPVMRPLWFEFPEDSESWNIEDEYTLGSALLVAPVTEAGVNERSVYLPGGTVWRDANTGTVYKGGQRVTVPAPLDVIPVFVRDNAEMTVF